MVRDSTQAVYRRARTIPALDRSIDHSQLGRSTLCLLFVMSVCFVTTITISRYDDITITTYLLAPNWNTVFILSHSKQQSLLPRHRVGLQLSQACCDTVNS